MVMTEEREGLVDLSDPNEYFHRLHKAYFPLLVKMTTNLVGSKELAEDIVQDAFHDTLAAYKRSGKLPPDSFRWFSVICQRKVYHYYEARNHDLALIAKLEQKVLVDPNASPSPEEILEMLSRNESEALKIIHRHLTPEEWDFLRRLTLEKTSHLTMAKELGISVWDSQKKLQRIRDKLAKHFPGYRKKKKLLIFLLSCQLSIFLYII